MSVGEVKKPKVRVVSVNSPKLFSSTIICCSCVWRKNGRSLNSSPTPLFLMIKNSRCELMRKIYRVLLTNHIVLYTRLTYVEPYQNILQHFCTKMHFLSLVLAYSICHFMFRLFIGTVVDHILILSNPRLYDTLCLKLSLRFLAGFWWKDFIATFLYDSLYDIVK